MVLDLLHRLVTSFYPERVNIYTLKNAIEIPFLGTCSNEKCFYTLGVPISRPLQISNYFFIFQSFCLFFISYFCYKNLDLMQTKKVINVVKLK